MTDRYIFKRKREENWTVLPNDMLCNDELSWEARGLLCYLLSKPKDWTVRKKDLEAQSPASEYVVKRILGELEDARYIRREKTRNDKGQWEWHTWVFDEPIPQNVGGGETIPQKTRHGLATDGKLGDIQSTDKQNTITEKSEKDWIAYLNGGSAYSSSKPPETTTSNGNRYDLSWLEEPLHGYAKAFIKAFDRKPVSDKEKDTWASCFREWMNLGVVPSQVKPMYRHARDEGMSIKSPYSISFAYDEIRQTATAKPKATETHR